VSGCLEVMFYCTTFGALRPHVKCGKCQDIAEWVNRRGFCLVDDGLFLSPSSKIQTMPAQP